MENSFKSIIDKSDSILILLPTRPYFDQVAAGLSLYLSLRADKNIQIYSPTPMTVEFNRLIGVNKITQELASKNLIIEFSDYQASDIERVSYDIIDGRFKLTVIPKPAAAPPKREQVDISYSGISADTVIIIGGTNEAHFPAINSNELVGANIVHIGTRDISISVNKNYISFSRPASSISEVIFSLLSEAQFPIDIDIATNLIMGIEEGSKNFSLEEVTANTFFAVSELMRMGGKRRAPVPSPASFPPGAIPGQFSKFPSQLQFSRQAKAGQFHNSFQKQYKKSQIKGENIQTADSGGVSDEDAPEEWLAPKIFRGGDTHVSD